MMLHFHFWVNYFIVNRFLLFGLSDTFICSVYIVGYEIIWKRVGESFCSVCLDVEIHKTGGGSIPQTLTWFLRSSAYVSPKYSTLQAGSTLSLLLPSSLFVSSGLEVLAIFLWRTGQFITATGIWLLYLSASEQLPRPDLIHSRLALPSQWVLQFMSPCND